MKILKIILTIVIVGGLLFFGSTYYFSLNAVKKADEWSKKISTMSYLKVADYQYKRGLFKSTQDITYELPSFGKNKQVERITFHNVIYHGPFPHFSSIGKARIEHTLSFSNDITQALAKLFNNKPPLEATTHIDLFGNGRTEIIGNAASFKDQSNSVSWGGLTGTIRFTKGMKSYQGEITSPGINIVSREGSGNLKNASLKFDQTKLANTQTLYTGDSSFHIEAISFTKADSESLQINNLDFKAGAHSQESQYVNVVGRLAIGDIRSKVFNIDNAEYAFSLKHLPIAEFDNWNKDLQLVNEQLAKHKSGSISPDK